MPSILEDSEDTSEQDKNNESEFLRLSLKIEEERKVLEEEKKQIAMERQSLAEEKRRIDEEKKDLERIRSQNELHSKPAVKEQPKPVVREQPKPVVREQPKPVVREQPKPVVKEQPQQDMNIKPVFRRDNIQRQLRESYSPIQNSVRKEEQPELIQPRLSYSLQGQSQEILSLPNDQLPVYSYKELTVHGMILVLTV